MRIQCEQYQYTDGNKGEEKSYCFPGKNDSWFRNWKFAILVLVFALSSLVTWSISAFISEKAMAPHSSTLAWNIPWTEEPRRLQSMGSRRVRQDRETSLSLFTFMHWRRKWQPTPVLLPGESQGLGSLVGCHLWGCTKSDMTDTT